MKLSKIGGLGSIALAFCLPAFGQGGANPPFTATGTTCSSVTWSQDALQKYPTIASACQDVLQRDGKSYVKFTGEVVRVVDGGRQLTIDFKGGGVFTVSPPENMNVSINDRRTRVRDLQRGDQLSFYIPQDRLAVDLFDGDAATAALQELPIEEIPAPLPEPAQAAAPAPQAAPAPAPSSYTRARPGARAAPADELAIDDRLGGVGRGRADRWSAIDPAFDATFDLKGRRIGGGRRAVLPAVHAPWRSGRVHGYRAPIVSSSARVPRR